MGPERTNQSEGPTLSVVVVTYNESEHIGSCLDSVFECCASFGDFEVIVVDSNSADETVDRALAFPVTVYQITDDDLCTPGAGRYVGTQFSDGEYVLFVDGDMTLTNGWISVATDLLEENNAVVGVDGYLDETSEVRSKEKESLRGVALYERGPLESVGGFDPHLHALEDIELGYRLTSAGHTLMRLPTVVANHHTNTGPAERLRRWRNGYYFGRGEAYRKSLGNPVVLWKLLYRARLRLVALVWLGLGGLSLFAGTALLVAWLAISVVLFGVLANVKGVSGAATLIACLPLVYAGILLGFLGRHPSPTEFPMSAVEQVGPLPDQPRRVSTDGR